MVINKTTAVNVAQWFIQHNYDHPRNKFDGNMKLQKMLYFSQLVHMAKYDEPLFEEKIIAFENGSVVEEVRQPYYYHNTEFIENALNTDVYLTREHLDSINTTIELFGDLSARELSDINHLHTSWKESFERSDLGHYYNKHLGEITLDQIRKNELEAVKDMIFAHESGNSLTMYEEINGVKFYYNPSEISLNDDVLELLQTFEAYGEESYTIYYDESAGLVIF
ncbi:Panacea domain-containing protein [Paenibacillus urinalis]|uniref:Panacea domain-containing protein n=1 Tax=Paenibacillus urinalis TaxID=521520 RepID=UPI001960580D